MKKIIIYIIIIVVVVLGYLWIKGTFYYAPEQPVPAGY